MSYFLTWVGLMIFLAITLGSSYIPMGPWNTALNMAISCAASRPVARSSSSEYAVANMWPG